MSQEVFSPSWYRVSGVRARLRGHVDVRRHVYRGELWYVARDPAKGRVYRFTPSAYRFIGLLDGELTVQQAWERVNHQLGDDAPTQVEVVRLLGQLHSADLLVSDVPPDAEELLQRAETGRRTRWKLNLMSPMSLRLPLLDPEKFLVRTAGVGRALYSWPSALIWALTVGAALVLAWVRWPELSQGVVDRVLSAEGLVSVSLIYPLVKVAHELGHAYAIKRWGGEVHELGLMFLVLVPVPYVDASAASAFPEAHRRAVVGAAGILAEVFVAALALFYWALAEPGALRSLAYSAAFVAGVSTVVFNGNPLLRYDGYYVFADLLGIPNLAQRSTGYLGWLVQHYLLGAARAEKPHLGPGEAFWLVFYGVGSFAYRCFVYLAIVFFIAGKFFVVGVLLALWAVWSMAVFPILKRTRFLLTSPLLSENRARAVVPCAVVLGVVVWGLFALHLPWFTTAEGVIWLPEDSLVRAGAEGFVERVVAAPNAPVRRGDLLIECADTSLVTELQVLAAQQAELGARRAAAVPEDPVQVRILEEEIRYLREQVERTGEKLHALQLRSLSEGTFVVHRPEDLPGRYVRQGELLGYVVAPGRVLVRGVVRQEDVEVVRERTRRVELRPMERLDPVLEGVVRREVPSGAEHLPSPILGTIGGGAIAVDPRDEKGTRALQKLFQFDIELKKPLDRAFIGGRVQIRFDHGAGPLAERMYRRIRQTFLKRFHA